MSTKKIANIAMLVALAIIFSYVELLIPINIGIPGVKLGLANLVIVIALYSLDMGDVWLISLVRIVLVGFMFGSLMSIAYSLAGAIVSLIAMMIIKKTDFFEKKDFNLLLSQKEIVIKRIVPVSIFPARSCKRFSFVFLPC